MYDIETSGNFPVDRLFILFENYHKHHDSAKNEGSVSYLQQTGEIKIDNFPSFPIFKGVLIFLGLFTSISTYFDPQIYPKSHNTPRNGG